MSHMLKYATFACLIPFAVSAQEGGVSVNFGVDQRFEANSDVDLTTEDADPGFTGITSLSFGAVTETRTQRLSADLFTDLRLSEVDFERGETGVSLAYTRQGVDSALSLSATTTFSEIAFLRTATDFVNSEGVLVLPEDFDDLIGTGTRITTRLGASLSWGENDPIGYSVGLNQSLLRYENANDSLLNSTATSASTGVRLNLNPVTTARFDLNYSQTDEDESAREDRLSFNGAVTFDRPLGDLTGRASATRTNDDDVFWSMSVARSLTVADQSVNGSFGLVEADDGDFYPTATVGYTYALPDGQIGLSARSNVNSGGSQRQSTVQANYSHTVNELQNLQFSFEFGRADDFDDDTSIATGTLTAAYGIRLTQDVQINLGATASVRDDDGTTSDNQSLFVTFGRSLTSRP